MPSRDVGLRENRERTREARLLLAAVETGDGVEKGEWCREGWNILRLSRRRKSVRMGPPAWVL